jgi:phosphoglycerol transferase MdoB-like AlkP superfamily enzyme
MGWGVHDDVAADVIAKYLIDRKEEQMKDPSTKKPLFLTTYTISSHTPFTHRPDWYLNDPSIPDFSALYNGETYSNDVKNYLEMRYFQDMALGNLMDKLNSSGVLNDSIVIIVGDHGQAPEFGLDIPEQRRVSVHRVGAALIAEGRLGKHAGMMYEDAAHQNDLLNTLADIVGVPETGFIQSGVGRSLKRKIQFGKRVVFANNPALKLAVIQAHLRVEFDKVTDVIRVYDVEKDVEQKDDLYATLADDPEKKKEFERMRDAGRWINKYFKIRWDGACILSPTC